MKNVKDKIGKDKASELEAMSADQLKQVIYEANDAMRIIQDELDANAAYQELLENKKAIEETKRIIFTTQKAVIAYSLQLMDAYSLVGDGK